MNQHINKYISADGLTLYELTGQPEIRDRISRICQRKLQVSFIDTHNESVIESPLVKREYRLSGRYFDSKRGFIVYEYREEI